MTLALGTQASIPSVTISQLQHDPECGHKTVSEARNSHEIINDPVKSAKTALAVSGYRRNGDNPFGLFAIYTVQQIGEPGSIILRTLSCS